MYNQLHAILTKFIPSRIIGLSRPLAFALRPFQPHQADRRGARRPRSRSSERIATFRQSPLPVDLLLQRLQPLTRPVASFSTSARYDRRSTDGRFSQFLQSTARSSECHCIRSSGAIRFEHPIGDIHGDHVMDGRAEVEAQHLAAGGALHQRVFAWSRDSRWAGCDHPA